MANPNIVGVTDIRGKTSSLALTTTAQTLVSNAASSGKVFKINSLYVSNTTGNSDQSVTVNYYAEDDIGGTASSLITGVQVPFNATLIVIEKDSSIYLEEDKSIGIFAGGNSELVAICSYEEIS